MRFLYSFLILLLVLYSCKSNTNKVNADTSVNKIEIAQQEQLDTQLKIDPEIKKLIPQCIIDKITKIKNGPVKNPPTVAKVLLLDGKRYYLIPSGCCDQYDYIKDEKCKTFCSQGYGINGKFKNGCESLKNAKQIVIWQDERTK